MEGTKTLWGLEGTKNAGLEGTPPLRGEPYPTF